MTPDQMRDASLLELFSLEADAQTQVLSAGLLALERNPTQADQLEACMRAAHSLKGAARIVGVDAGVSVAHVMEDCLVSAQEGRLYLQPEHIDALLQGTDLLMRIATPGNDVGPADIEAYVALMERLLDPSQPIATPVPNPEPIPAPRVDALLLEPELEPAPVSSEAPRQSKRMTEGGERVLRVTAERLNSLLDLSSKSLVETQRLKPYLASLQRLKRIQSNSLRALDALDGQLKSLDLNLEAQEALADTRRLLSEAQALLAEKTPSWMSSAGRPASAPRCSTTPHWPAACGRLPMCWPGRCVWCVTSVAAWASKCAWRLKAKRPRSTVTCWKNSKRRSPIYCAMPSTTASKPLSSACWRASRRRA